MNAVSTLIHPFAAWMEHLRSYLWTRAAPQAALGPLLPLLYNYVGRAARRLDSLVLKWERDALPTQGSPRPARARAPAATPRLRLPTRQNWLHLLHQPFVLYRGAVERLLEDPDTRALAEAAPQAGRILRPLARMFGATPPAWLALPKHPRKARPAAPPKPPKPRQTPARGFTRAQIARMTAADLLAHYGRLPPHFPLPIPNLNLIRRKIAAG